MGLLYQDIHYLKPYTGHVLQVAQDINNIKAAVLNKNE